jgi:tRNA-splicing ligase RtcB
MFELKQIAPATYLLPRHGAMRVDGLVIASHSLLADEEMARPLEQVCNVATLPGIVGYSIAMPDIHWGYGFPIGGVAAMDLDEGVISPGGVGYDINCGVRLALVPLPFSEISQARRQELLDALFARIPSGTGQGSTAPPLSDADYRGLVEKGAIWSVEQGFGLPQDIDHTESRGRLEEADLSAVSAEAKLRGKKQLGSIGSGNHFVEIGEVAELFQPLLAKQWGVERGQTYVLIHTGSRGFGHQICQETLDEFLKKGYGSNLADKQLVAAPIRSPEGRLYWKRMAAAANFAFNNRQRILHAVREAFHAVCSIPPDQIPLLYDVCHNIAKIETHRIEGVERRLCVHRKGATRALGPGAPELASLFRESGQPVLVPGDMGRASYLMVGQGNPLTWCTACHGAGRARSRIRSMEAWKGKSAIEHMEQQGVKVVARSYRTIAEEMPDAYKDVHAVVEAVKEAGLAQKVARLRPALVLKG